MKRSFGYSFILHLLIFLALIFGVDRVERGFLTHSGMSSVNIEVASSQSDISIPKKAHQVPFARPARNKEVSQISDAPTAPVAAQSGETENHEGTKRSFIDELISAIEKCKEYPTLALQRRQAGRVEVGFTMKKSGLITNIRLVTSCEYRNLNEAAIQTISKLGTFKPVPDEISKSDWDVVVPIDYRLKSN